MVRVCLLPVEHISCTPVRFVFIEYRILSAETF